MAEACRSFNISRKTGYKWLRRYEKDGDSGLMDQSRRPVNQPTKLSEKVLLRIVCVRVAHKHWGADKIRAILKREHISPLPGRTTIHRVLRQAGLINLRRKRIPRLDNLRLVQDGGETCKSMMNGQLILSGGSQKTGKKVLPFDDTRRKKPFHLRGNTPS